MASTIDDMLNKLIEQTDRNFAPLPDVQRSDGKTYQNIPYEDYRRALTIGKGDVDSALLKHEDDAPTTNTYHHTYDSNGQIRQWKIR